MKLQKIEKTYHGKYLKYYDLTYENKAGKEKHYEIVSRHEISDVSDLGNHVSGVSIVATYKGKLLLLKEFRMGVGKEIYNLCAGMIEPGETLEKCIRRELFEETGLKSVKILDVLEPSYAAVAISDVLTQIAFVEVDGEISAAYQSANEQIEANFYTREQVQELLKTERFSSRAQIAAYFFTRGAIG